MGMVVRYSFRYEQFQAAAISAASILLVGFGAAPGFVSSASAADDCAHIAQFDTRGRMACEAAARDAARGGAPSQSPRPQVNYTSDTGSGRDRGTENQDGSPPEPLPERASGLQRYDVAKGSLSVEVAGDYPQGYGPAWTLNGATAQQISMNRYNILNHGPQGTATFFIRIVDDQGRAALEFGPRGTQACIADIVGLPQVITTQPKTFRLANFHYAGNQGPQCQRKLTSAPAWQGSLTLSANPAGDISVSLVLDQAMDSGAPWFEFTVQNLPFPNRMTPQMAFADMENKKQAALAAEAREKEAAAARLAEAQARAKEEDRLKAQAREIAAFPKESRSLMETSQMTREKFIQCMGGMDVDSVHAGKVYDGMFESDKLSLSLDRLLTPKQREEKAGLVKKATQAALRGCDFIR